MYSSTSADVVGLLGGGGRKWKFWLGRRIFSRQLVCRLPLLILWTLIVIVVLYRSLSSETDSIDKVVIEEDKNIELNQNDLEAEKINLDLLKQQQQDQLNVNEQHYVSETTTTKTRVSNIKPTVITSLPTTRDHPLPTITTKKSIIEDYSRRSKVFILIIQNENLYSSQSFKPSSYSRSFSDAGHSPQGANHPPKRAFIPAHLRLLMDILNSHRIEYTIDTTRMGLPTSLLIDQDNSSENKQYSVIVIDDFIKYTKLNRWVRDQLDRHCRANQIGVVAYLTATTDTGTINHQSTGDGDSSGRTKSDKTTTTEESLANQFPLSFRWINQNKACHNLSTSPPTTCLVDYQLNDKSSILRILKRRQNFIIDGPLGANINQSPWVSMSSNHITYEPLTWAKFGPPQNDEKNSPTMSKLGTRTTDFIQNGRGGAGGVSRENESQQMILEKQVMEDTDERFILSMFDRGLYDGIKRVIFGGASHHWLNRIILLDAVEHLSSGRIMGPLDRYIQIDIDDIFVGERGTRMNSSDVDALIATQNELAQRIDGGFKFNLGYSGKYFKHGFEHENLGDERLISRANEFTWFCHTWSHSKAHLLNDDHSIVMELEKNLEFARRHKLPLIGHVDTKHGDKSDLMVPTYAIAPHHSGGMTFCCCCIKQKCYTTKELSSLVSTVPSARLSPQNDAVSIMMELFRIKVGT